MIDHYEYSRQRAAWWSGMWGTVARVTGVLAAATVVVSAIVSLVVHLP